MPKVTQPGNDRTRIRIQAREDRVRHSNPPGWIEAIHVPSKGALRIW